MDNNQNQNSHEELLLPGNTPEATDTEKKTGNENASPAVAAELGDTALGHSEIDPAVIGSGFSYEQNPPHPLDKPVTDVTYSPVEKTGVIGGEIKRHERPMTEEEIAAEREKYTGPDSGENQE
ncbi:MAG TPA: hypothetical protein VH144_01645 [Candidatus Saccharimonadales bacterium]|jgi:hypothetical protein|nr:hypothetical protein [Candidatus Saccharimonadales bacterium]